jgi:hypothetical protein
MRRSIFSGLFAVGLAISVVSASAAPPASGIPGADQLSIGAMTIPVQRRSQRVCRQDCRERCRHTAASKKGCFSQCTRHCVHR